MAEQQQTKINVSPIEVLVMAAQLANSRGAFNLNEAAIISEAINSMVTSNGEKQVSRPQTELERMIINAHNTKKSEEEKDESSSGEKQRQETSL